MLKLRKFAPWVVAVLVTFFALSAQGFSTSMSSNYVGGALSTGDTVTVTVDFDTEGEADISLLSVSVLFDTDAFTWDQGSSVSPTYALYVSGGKNNQYLVDASTNLTIRAGTTDQILLDWQNTALPGGNRDACGITNLDPVSACGFQMATLVFTMTSALDEVAFTISNSSPGNILQLEDGSNPDNAVTGDFEVNPASCGSRVVRDFNCDGKSDMLFVIGNVMRSVIIDGTAATAAANSGITFASENVIGTAHLDDDNYSEIVTQYGSAQQGLIGARSLDSVGLGTEPGSYRFFGMGTDGDQWTYIGSGDANADGVDDLYFVADSENPNEGLVRIILVTEASYSYAHPGYLPELCTPSGVADINADGRADVSCQQPTGLVFAMLMDASGEDFEAPYSFLVNLASILTNAGTFEFALGNYTFADLDQFDSDGGADVVLSKVSSPTGLVGLLLNSGTPTSSVFIPSTTTPNYVVLQNTDYELAPVGNYDGLNQSDLSSRYQGAAIGNSVQNFLLAADGVSRLGNGWPVVLPQDWVLVD